jgi:hypothetical protein
MDGVSARLLADGRVSLRCDYEYRGRFPSIVGPALAGLVCVFARLCDRRGRVYVRLVQRGTAGCWITFRLLARCGTATATTLGTICAR